jgi:hypothetical protein
MQPNEMKTKNVWTSGHEKVQVTSGEMMMQVLLNCLAGGFENCFVMTLREDLLLFGFVRTSGSLSLLLALEDTFQLLARRRTGYSSEPSRTGQVYGTDDWYPLKQRAREQLRREGRLIRSFPSLSSLVERQSCRSSATLQRCEDESSLKFCTGE